jgi:hypothetical protein
LGRQAAVNSSLRLGAHEVHIVPGNGEELAYGAWAMSFSDMDQRRAVHPSKERASSRYERGTTPMGIVRRALSFSALLLMMSCGDDEGTPSDPHAAAPVEDASVSTKEIASVVTDVIGDYDRLLMNNCPCFVEMGAYASIDECVMWQSSREDWIPCLRGVLAKHRSPETLDAFRCMQDEVEAMTECLATKACDPMERAECDRNPIGCLAAQTEVGLEVATQCPDITLLPREN